MSEDMTLEAVFAMQDRAARHNEASSNTVRKQIGFVSEAVAEIFSLLSSTQFTAHKQHVLRTLGADALSSIVCGVRVGLWGNLPEGTALLRSALETCAILAATVAAQDYDAVAGGRDQPGERAVRGDSGLEGIRQPPRRAPSVLPAARPRNHIFNARLTIG